MKYVGYAILLGTSLICSAAWGQAQQPLFNSDKPPAVGEDKDWKDRAAGARRICRDNCIRTYDADFTDISSCQHLIKKRDPFVACETARIARVENTAKACLQRCKTY
jgi:hypothetical protein